MKNYLFMHAVTCVSLILHTHNLFCQNIAEVKNVSIRSAETVTPYHNSALPVNTTTNFRNAIHIKAVRGFIKNFGKAENVLWRTSTQGYYVAEFANDSVQSIVEYNPRGSWVCTIKRYAENRLPARVKAMIKSSYANYTIKKIEEIMRWQNREDITYSILLRNRAEIRLVSICNGELTVAAAFTDQKVSVN